jgi:hypothetical protein
MSKGPDVSHMGRGRGRELREPHHLASGARVGVIDKPD